MDENERQALLRIMGGGVDSPVASNSTIGNITDVYQNVGLPIAGIIEAIATNGKSPGTTAMRQQQIIASAQEANRRNMEERRKQALEAMIQGEDIGFKQRQEQRAIDAAKSSANEQAKKDSADEKLALKKSMYQAAIKSAQTSEEKRQLVLNFLAEEDPAKYASETRPHEPNQIEELISALKLKSLENTVKQQENPRLTANTIETLTDLQNFPQKLNLLKEGIKANPDIMGPAIGRIQQAKGAIGLTDDSTLRAQGLQQKYEAVKQIVAKAMEGGVLRKEDMPKYEKILGSILISPQAAEQNIGQLESMLAQDYNNKINSFKQQGYNISGFSPISTEIKAQATTFNSVQEAEAANLPKGTVIFINGRKAVVE